MTDYEKRVERYLEGIEHVSPGAAPGCPECLECDDPDNVPDDWYDLANEPWFSWKACDACGSTLGGDRHPAHGFDKGEISSEAVVHLDICTDCVFYLAYGEVPDEEAD